MRHYRFHFIVPILYLAILLIPIWIGRKKPIIPTFIFLGLSFLLLILQFAYNDTSEGEHSRALVLPIAFFLLALGSFYLYKTIERKKISTKNNNHTVTNTTFSTDNLQLDIYTQIKT